MLDFLTLIHCDQAMMELLNRLMMIVIIFITLCIAVEAFYAVRTDREGTEEKINIVINRIKKNLGLI